MRAHLAILALASGCGRIGFDSLYSDEFIVTTPADRLAVPPTATSIDQRDPGITDLSLREALTIASNLAGPVLIAFDPRVFPSAQPTTITITSQLPSLTGSGTVIDGYTGGVVVDTDPSYTGPILEVAGMRDEVRGVGFAGSSTRLVVDGPGARIVGNHFVGGGIAIDATAGDLEISGNGIVGASGNGIRLASITGGITHVEDNEITGVVGDPIAASDSTSLDVRNNRITLADKTSGHGIIFNTVSSSTIADNVIDPGEARMIGVYDSPDIQVVGNILDGGAVGIVVEGAASNPYVFRNVILNPSGEPMYIGVDSTGTTVLNTTLYKCTSGIAIDAPGVMDQNTLMADTGFVDPASYDFRLVAGSTAVDQAVDVGQDMLPNSPARFLGAAPDLGAVETR